jgi:hypothetical protein
MTIRRYQVRHKIPVDIKACEVSQAFCASGLSGRPEARLYPVRKWQKWESADQAVIFILSMLGFYP